MRSRTRILVKCVISPANLKIFMVLELDSCPRFQQFERERERNEKKENGGDLKTLWEFGIGKKRCV